MATTIAVSDQTRRRLMRLKLDENAKSVDELLERVLTEYRRAKLRESSAMLQRWMQEKDLTFREVTGKDPLE